jgi:hypothetical protein
MNWKTLTIPRVFHIEHLCELEQEECSREKALVQWTWVSISITYTLIMPGVQDILSIGVLNSVVSKCRCLPSFLCDQKSQPVLVDEAAFQHTRF